MFAARVMVASLAAIVLGCNPRSDRSPSGPSAVEPAPPSATTSLGPGEAPLTTNLHPSTVSWGCLTGDAERSAFSDGEWTIQRDPCPSTSHRNRTANETVSPIFSPAPTNLRATVTGMTVQLNWDQPPVAFAWQLEAGSGPGLSNIAVFRTTAGTSLTVTGVPPGTYYVRVRSAPPDFSDLSAPSNEITVIVGSACTGPPPPPTGLHKSILGNQVTLSWNQPSGQIATSYVLEVGSTSGSITFPVIETGSAATTLQASAPNGLYFVRVRARNACGTSGPSNELDVPVGIDLPSPPDAVFTVRGGLGREVNPPICSYNINQACQFDGSASTGTGLTSYAWDFGDRGTASGPVVVHAFPQPAQFTITAYDVRLTVTDAFGRKSTATRSVTVAWYH